VFGYILQFFVFVFTYTSMKVRVSRKLMSVLFCVEFEHDNPVRWNTLFSCMIIHIQCEYTKCAARPICSQENPFHTVAHYLFKINFNNMQGRIKLFGAPRQ